MYGVESAYVSFAEWLDKQAYWLQDAVWRIYNHQKIDDAQIHQYAEMCLAESQGKTDIKYHHMDAAMVLPKTILGQMKIKRIYNIDGVNDLGKEAALSFSDKGLTVVYGLNGAGKSSFMRIFKHVSNNPYQEIIQPNIFSNGTTSSPKCCFDILREGTEETVHCSLATNETSPLRDCDVFDTRISGAYISKANTVSYQPFIFTVLSELAQIADKISRYIDQIMISVSDIPITKPSEFEAAPQLEWLDHITDKSFFPDSCREWSDTDEADLQSCERRLDIESVKAKVKAIKPHVDLLTALSNDLSNIETHLDVDAIGKAYIEYQSSQEKYTLARNLFGESANEFDKVSSSLESWKNLWEIAKEYYESVLMQKIGGSFGDDGTICPLCHQTITGDTYLRFSRVNEYINGTCSSDLQRKTETLETLIKAAFQKTMTCEEISRNYTAYLDDTLLSNVLAVYDLIKQIKECTDVRRQYELVSQLSLHEIVLRVQQVLNDVTDELTKLEEGLLDQNRVTLQSRVVELRIHKWVHQQKDSIEHNIANQVQISAWTKAKSLLKTNRITKQANLLAESLITDAYISRFTSELKRLGPRLKVKLEKSQSAKGNSPYKITLDAPHAKNSRPEDILSEGEQRIVSLAAFFADATGRNELTPIIIDDPISSLDINYENAATQRIVELAQQRQVIVFTHRISLLVGISEVCNKMAVPFSEQYIRSTSRGKGLPDFDDVYRGKLKEQVKALLSKIGNIEKKDVDSPEYLDAIGRLCQQFRICVERSVEDVLLLGMVHRFERRIMTNKKVTKLTRIEDADCKIIDDFMTKYSFSEHSQPSGCLDDYIPLPEIKKDVETFRDWITEYNKKMA